MEELNCTTGLFIGKLVKFSFIWYACSCAYGIYLVGTYIIYLLKSHQEENSLQMAMNLRFFF